MKLEKWLEKYDVKKMVMENLKYYLSEYKKDDEEDFNELFKGMNIDNVKYEFHSVSYVINTLYIEDENEAKKYISAKVRLVYEDKDFAEYQAFYGLDGEYEDDYLLCKYSKY